MTSPLLVLDTFHILFSIIILHSYPKKALHICTTTPNSMTIVIKCTYWSIPGGKVMVGINRGSIGYNLITSTVHSTVELNLSNAPCSTF